ncbi:ABC transporter permease [Chakrabartyella piscis]|uniref:ABC transporter permease n=1 Tax=Chakrabartyella piscis TaxID=2918914 RepID=UPI002958D1DB|nr:ABC transporter permease [Chakrabartyella piscis]
MSIKDLLDMALRNLLKRKLRTFLTILGVVIGTTSIVVMVSIGLGMNQTFANQLSEWGSLQVIDVYSQNSNMYWGGNDEESTFEGEAPKLDDAAIAEFKLMDSVEAVSPVVDMYLKMQFDKYVADASIRGIEPAAMEALGFKVEQGRYLNGEDGKAIVLGADVMFYDPKLSWEMVYSTEPPEVYPLDETVEVSYDWNLGTRDADKSIKSTKFEVVGITPSGGMDGWSVYMPIAEAKKIQEAQLEWQEEMWGSSSSSSQKDKEYDRVMVKVDNMDDVRVIQQSIKDMGFRASSLTDQLDAMNETTKMLRVVLGAIGAISLVVAAIGITNTMVMAIYERTREIGIMKVIGASLRDIKLLFLTEAAFIGFGGGILGALFSLIMSKIINYFAMSQGGGGFSSYIPVWLYVGSIGFATVIGILSGYLPAQRAMKLSALSAIKTE